MDLNKSIRMAVDTGKVAFGSETAKKLALSGGAKIVVIAENCPLPLRQDLEKYCKLSSVPLVAYSGSSIKLGTVCGKPFTVAAMSIVSEGNSDIMGAVKK